jgi:predicted small secreted protein/chromosome segregation ATPase
MRRIAAPALLLSLAFALASAGCRGAGKDPSAASGAGGGEVGETVAALGAFTEELASKVESAQDTKAGLAEAQKILDERRGALSSRVAALRASPELKSDSAARGRLLEAEVDNTERVHRLQVKYSDASTRDPDLKARLDKLVSDYDSIFR